MFRKISACSLLVMLPFLTLAKSPYSNLSYALREQQIITDLRNHCHLAQDIPDERIKQVFLNSSENHDAIVNAADALKKNNQTTYHQHIKQVSCPKLAMFSGVKP